MTQGHERRRARPVLPQSKLEEKVAILKHHLIEEGTSTSPTGSVASAKSMKTTHWEPG